MSAPSGLTISPASGRIHVPPNGQGTQTLTVHASASAAQTFYTVPVSLSDGSTARFWLGLSDWTLNAGRSQPSFGNQVAAHMTYRNCAGCSSGKDTVSTNVFYTALPVDPSKTLTGVTLPNGADQGELHIFAVGTSAQALSPPVAASLTPATAAAGQQVTINGSGFGASQGSGYVAFSDNGINWGAPGNAATFHIDSWSDTAITFTVPTPSGGNGQFHVFSGTPASVTVVNNSGRSRTPRNWISPLRPTRVTTTTTPASRRIPTRPAPTTTVTASATRPTRWPPAT